jgi:hypothetical protein
MTDDNSAIKDKKSPNTNPTHKPSIPVTETEEYKTLFSQKQILQERISELEEIVKESMKTNPAIGFQSATDMVAARKPGPGMEALMSATGLPDSVEFPANLFSKFFIASRNVKTKARLKLNSDGIVEGWVIE